MKIKCKYCGEISVEIRDFFKGGCVCGTCRDFLEWKKTNPSIIVSGPGPRDDIEAFNYTSGVAQYYSVDRMKFYLETRVHYKTFYSFLLNNGESKDIFLHKTVYDEDDEREIKFSFIEGYRAIKKTYDEPTEDGFYSCYVDSGELVRILIKDIRKVTIHWINDYPEEDVEEPIIGFKALECKDGIIKSNKGLEYKLGLPVEVERVPAWDKCAFNDCYLHFCTKIETVLWDWNYDCLGLNTANSTEKLYRVKAGGHVFPRYDRKDSWVASKLTILGEVTKDEIIEYFNSTEELKDKLEKINARAKKIRDKNV